MASFSEPKFYDQMTPENQRPMPVEEAQVIEFPSLGEDTEEPLDLNEALEVDEGVHPIRAWNELSRKQKALWVTAASVAIAPVAGTLNSTTMGEGLIKRYHQIENIFSSHSGNKQSSEFIGSKGQRVNLG